ncbi:MAG: S41 family peptidase [Thermomicrobiales bacterium]
MNLDSPTTPEAHPGSRRFRPAFTHLRLLVTASMLVLAVGAGIGIDRYLIVGSQAGQQTETFQDADKDQVLDQVYQLIRQNYVLSDDITDDQLVYGAATGMVDALGDTGHSTFLDPAQAEQFEQQTKGELVGIGIQVDTTGELPVVIAPIHDSPAEKAGIKPGDTILEIDGKSLEGMDPADATDLLRGEEGTKVTLKLQHEGESDTYEVTITRATITIDPVSWAMLPNDVAWVSLTQFTSGATEKLQAALREAKAAGAKGVILDLRNNPGGLVFEAIGVASQFLPANTPLFQQKDRDGNTKTTKSVGSNGEWQEGPLVVLINEGSASSSELVSSAIQDAKRGVLLGETTFGTGTVLQPFQVSDGSVALLGVQLWLTANGNDIYKKGVEPDVKISNEPGVYDSVPTDFEDNTVSSDQFTKLEDNQLVSAHEDMLKLIDGEPIATPVSN